MTSASPSICPRSLRAALKAMDARSKKLNEPILDFDPVTDSQDPRSSG